MAYLHVTGALTFQQNCDLDWSRSVNRNKLKSPGGVTAAGQLHNIEPADA
jgi:hypothetical protein